MPFARLYRKAQCFTKRDYEAVAQGYLAGAEGVRDEVNLLLGRDTNIRMLDVGCGEIYPATIMFSAWGWNVTGIDLDPIWRESPWRVISSAVKAGPREALKKTVHEAIVVKRTQRNLLRLAGIKMPQRLDIRYMSVSNLNFADGEFDFIYSNAVLEHVMDLDKAANEMLRVLKPGGVGHHLIHLFTSLSGGHDDRWAKPDERIPKDVPPWDHLLSGNSPSINTLNKLREKDYKQCLEKRCEIVEWKKTREGEKLLTPELRQALSEYDEDELLTRAIKVVLRKPA